MYKLYDEMFGSELLGVWDTTPEVQAAARARYEEAEGMCWLVLRKAGEKKPVRDWTF